MVVAVRRMLRWLLLAGALCALSLLAALMVFSASWALESLHLLPSSPARVLELLAALAAMCASALLFVLDLAAILWLTGEPGR